MPELPEVESIRLGLLKVIVGQKILNIKIKNEKMVSSHSNIRKANKIKTESFIKNLIDKKIINIARRAKNLIIQIEDGGIILIHLKMTGQLIYTPPLDLLSKGEEEKHTHIIFTLEKGALIYNDIRQFGYVLYYKNKDEMLSNNHFYKIGIEPFDGEFTLEYFKNKLNIKSSKSLKTIFLSQEIVVGVGNIYADEICFASHILPQRLSGTLTSDEIKLLYKQIKKILKSAIDSGGSSISDYKLVNGESGNYQNMHKVYNRAGKECYTCKSLLNKTIIAGRSTVYCKMCQK